MAVRGPSFPPPQQEPSVFNYKKFYSRAVSLIHTCISFSQNHNSTLLPPTGNHVQRKDRYFYRICRTPTLLTMAMYVKCTNYFFTLVKIITPGENRPQSWYFAEPCCTVWEIQWLKWKHNRIIILIASTTSYSGNQISKSSFNTFSFAFQARIWILEQVR